MNMCALISVYTNAIDFDSFTDHMSLALAVYAERSLLLGLGGHRTIKHECLHKTMVSRGLYEGVSWLLFEECNGHSLFLVFCFCCEDEKSLI